MSDNALTPVMALEEGRALVSFLGGTVDLLLDTDTEYARELRSNQDFAWGLRLCFYHLEKMLADGLEATQQKHRARTAGKAAQGEPVDAG